MSTQREESAAEPRASRLTLPRGYETAGETALLAWSNVEDQLERAANYWLATTRPDGRPHVAPVWGVWLERSLWFTGIPTARWARNVVANPAVSVHLESGSDVVIVEGIVEDFPSISDRDLATRIVAAWDSKYGRLHPDPVADGMYWAKPRSVCAWSQFPDDATRWTFDDE